METILVTGATGFIGSNLIPILLQKGNKVIALSYPPKTDSISNILSYDKKISFITGDIKDSVFCDKICFGIDKIYHLAALADVPNSFKNPNDYIDTNIKGTLNICNAALKNKVSRIIIVSSAAVYGEAQYLPIDETHPLQPKSPYSASKLGAEAIALSMYYSYYLPITIVRPFNTYGPNQSDNAVISSIINQIISGKQKILVGDLSPKRDFIYATDLCNSMIALSESDAAIGEIVNIGTNVDTSIEEVIAIIKDVLKKDVVFETDKNLIRHSNSEISEIRCDNSKLISLTGFIPKISVKEGIAKIIENLFKGTSKNQYYV
ncbi:MAG: SDR family NAD(P)-dependent oxidoreductase [Bacteroidetes bacterium]|nr:SDR family NAD(P)-dependent oxidoreductase [Bacteroidota bacterium]